MSVLLRGLNPAPVSLILDLLLAGKSRWFIGSYLQAVFFLCCNGHVPSNSPNKSGRLQSLQLSSSSCREVWSEFSSFKVPAPVQLRKATSGQTAPIIRKVAFDCFHVQEVYARLPVLCLRDCGHTLCEFSDQSPSPCGFFTSISRCYFPTSSVPTRISELVCLENRLQTLRRDS